MSEQKESDLTRVTLARIRNARRQGSVAPEPQTPSRRQTWHSRSTSGSEVRSGPGPDERDPQGLATGISRLLVDRGWGSQAAAASLIERWPEIVGPDIAKHCVPESFDPTTAKLLLRASSTAWKTQLQHMLPLIRDRVDATIGRGVVADISVAGPVPPRTFQGPRRLRGRGPRDTWG